MAAKKSVRKGRKTPDRTAVVKIQQPHGGAIYAGGVPGNKGGTGRPPDDIRAAMREKLDKALPRLWSEYEAGIIDALGFANFLAKYGLQSKELVITSDNAAGFFDCVHAAVVELFGESSAEQVKARALAMMEAKA